MSYETRRDFILEKLVESDAVKVQELSQQLQVTRETIRKDLYDLEKEGLIKKIHGGAVLETHNRETDYEKRKQEFWAEKERIAKKAAAFIEEGDSVYLDYGTTTFALAKEMLKLKNITVVTNTLPIINLLLRNKDINLMILGGVVRSNESSLYGQFASNNIKDIFVNLGFFGCSGIDARKGITSHHMGENQISKEMIHQSQTSIILTDHSKFNTLAFNKTADFDDVDIIITDNRIDPEDSHLITQHGTKLIIAEEE